jgi:hypothetical protein
MRWLLLAGLLVLTASAASAQWWYLLWDNGPFDGDLAIGNGKGTETYFGQIDMQVADDFEVSDPGWWIDRVHFEGLCFFGGLQVDYVTVEIFRDNGGIPFEDPFISLNAHDIEVSDWYDPNWGCYHVDIDVYPDRIEILPGFYWIKTQPYGLWGDWFYQGCTAYQWIQYCAVRDGPWGGGFGHYEWAHDYERDVNFRIYTYIPEPAAFTAAAGMLLGLAGIVWRRRQIGR